VNSVISKLIIWAFIFILLLSLSACGKTYKIGDAGPAGGIVFYDKGHKTEGWRYLEVSPIEAEFTAPWGLYGVAVEGTGTGIGEGKNNTDFLVSMTDSEGKANAGYRCNQLEINGYKDWFLPSKDELDLIYRYIPLQSIGDSSDDWYWSSSVWDDDDDGANEQDSLYYTWAQRLISGEQGYIIYEGGLDPRNYELRVRAVRSF